MFILGVAIYVWVTPHREFALVRQNNVAAAIALGSAMLGLAIPLASAMANSVNLTEIAIWGGVAVVLQILAFKIVDLLMRNLSDAIEQGQIAPALVLAATKLSVCLRQLGRDDLRPMRFIDRLAIGLLIALVILGALRERLPGRTRRRSFCPRTADATRGTGSARSRCGPDRRGCLRSADPATATHAHSQNACHREGAPSAPRHRQSWHGLGVGR